MIAFDEQHLHQRAALVVERRRVALDDHARPAARIVHEAVCRPSTLTVQSLHDPCGLKSGW